MLCSFYRFSLYMLLSLMHNLRMRMHDYTYREGSLFYGGSIFLYPCKRHHIYYASTIITCFTHTIFHPVFSLGWKFLSTMPVIPSQFILFSWRGRWCDPLGSHLVGVLCDVLCAVLLPLFLPYRAPFLVTNSSSYSTDRWGAHSGF